jgi:predicted regulator of Ras-like GTPase activity (Roadblock/LC7/MglB family)
VLLACPVIRQSPDGDVRGGVQSDPERRGSPRQGRERKVVFIVDKNGQLIAASGDVDNLDTTSLASLTAGNIAATGGMAKLLKENEFATQFHEGEKANIHIQLVGNRVILVVIFDAKSSLGLVRLRVRKASEELNHIFEALLKKVRSPEPTRRSPRSPTKTSTTSSTTRSAPR